MRWALPFLLVLLVLGCAQAPQEKGWSSFDPGNATHREGLEGIFRLLEKYPGGYERAFLGCAPQYCRELKGRGVPERLELEEAAGEGAVRLLEIVVKGERGGARGYGSPLKEGLLKAAREYEGSEYYHTYGKYTYQEAQDLAASFSNANETWRLVSINSAAENELVRNMLGGSSAWIGGYDVNGTTPASWSQPAPTTNATEAPSPLTAAVRLRRKSSLGAVCGFISRGGRVMVCSSYAGGG